MWFFENTGTGNSFGGIHVWIFEIYRKRRMFFFIPIIYCSEKICCTGTLEGVPVIFRKAVKNLQKFGKKYYILGHNLNLAPACQMTTIVGP
jgi:hypothetical protein